MKKYIALNHIVTDKSKSDIKAGEEVTLDENDKETLSLLASNSIKEVPKPPAPASPQKVKLSTLDKLEPLKKIGEKFGLTFPNNISKEQAKIEIWKAAGVTPEQIQSDPESEPEFDLI